MGATWELVVVNDGSTDNAPEVVKRYIDNSDHKNNIRLINQPNGGVAAARNTGITHSTGEFIGFNDSDDKWLEGKLNLQLDYLENHSEVVMVGGIFGNDNMSAIKKIYKPTNITIKDQVLKNYFSPQATLLRRSILEKSGLFNESMRYAEEGYFFNNVVFHGYAVLLPNCVTKPIGAKNRWGDNGLSGNLVKMEQGELFNIRSAYRLGYISLSRTVFAVCFSLAKFVRRWLISKCRKICK